MLIFLTTPNPWPLGLKARQRPARITCTFHLPSGGHRHCYSPSLFARPLTLPPDSWTFREAICQVEDRMEGRVGELCWVPGTAAPYTPTAGSFLIITSRLSSPPCSQLPVGCLPNKEFHKDGCLFCVRGSKQKGTRHCKKSFPPTLKTVGVWEAARKMRLAICIGYLFLSSRWWFLYGIAPRAIPHGNLHTSF